MEVMMMGITLHGYRHLRIYKWEAVSPTTGCLGKATKEPGLDDYWIHQGLKILQAHRSNYGSGGPSNMIAL